MVDADILSLPFIDDNDCGLGIAVRTYLDDLPLQAEPTSPDSREEVKSKGKEWFQHSDSFTGNLNRAFTLWDAVGRSVFLSSNRRLRFFRSTRVRRTRAKSLRTVRLGQMRTNGYLRDGDPKKKLWMAAPGGKNCAFTGPAMLSTIYYDIFTSYALVGVGNVAKMITSHSQICKTIINKIGQKCDNSLSKTRYSLVVVIIMNYTIVPL